ncbi:hypothetical protein LZU96_00815 [Pantoea agglomerans]|uniref:hypothetical protein n=1 Tax=Enterobacter agglomerans TaxID=549 RepID=UPI001F356984|nr:hypothetical protein [Pantoea agglomerans]UIL52542.1 hypothetical protein LZU96_00815 [Pantoea agglomerans]
MAILTKNFRLNALANQFAAAMYNSVRQQNGGDWFPMTVNGHQIQVAIVDGMSGIRMLVDSYLLEPMKKAYPNWEQLASDLLILCLDGNEPSGYGQSIWQSMINDMSASLSGSEGHFHA